MEEAVLAPITNLIESLYISPSNWHRRPSVPLRVCSIVHCVCQL